jgi:hypothetical protein
MKSPYYYVALTYLQKKGYWLLFLSSVLLYVFVLRLLVQEVSFSFERLRISGLVFVFVPTQLIGSHLAEHLVQAQAMCIPRFRKAHLLVAGILSHSLLAVVFGVVLFLTGSFQVSLKLLNFYLILTVLAYWAAFIIVLLKNNPILRNVTMIICWGLLFISTDWSESALMLVTFPLIYILWIGLAVVYLNLREDVFSSFSSKKFDFEFFRDKLISFFTEGFPIYANQIKKGHEGVMGFLNLIVLAFFMGISLFMVISEFMVMYEFGGNNVGIFTSAMPATFCILFIGTLINIRSLTSALIGYELVLPRSRKDFFRDLALGIFLPGFRCWLIISLVSLIAMIWLKGLVAGLSLIPILLLSLGFLLIVPVGSYFVLRQRDF